MKRYVYLRYPEGLAKAVTFSYDDGCPEDKRFAEILDAHGLKCTFNHNADEIRPKQFSPAEVEEYFLSKGHEIAVHGSLHVAEGATRAIEGITDVLTCRLELERKYSRIIRGMAYPDSGITRIHGTHTSYEEIKSYLGMLGIAYARSLAGDNDRFELPTDFYAWIPSAHHDNPKISEYIDKFLSINMDDLRPASRFPRLFYIWGHSFEFERKDNWDHAEEIAERLGGHDDIWYATNIEICDYVEAYKRLVYSADGSIIYNPTITKLWFYTEGKTYSINPGETIKI